MLFDTHAHYYAEQFDPDRDEVLSALPAANVGLVLCPGCDLESSRQSIALAEQYPFLYAAAGVHPEDALGLPDDWLEQVEAMTHHPKVKAVGEIGLDYYWQEVPRDLQKEVFRAQLALAQRLDMPVIVHDREAHGDSLAIVKEFPGVRGVFHCYTPAAWRTPRPSSSWAGTCPSPAPSPSKMPAKPRRSSPPCPWTASWSKQTPPTWPPRPTAASGATPATSTAWPKPSPRSRA